MMAQPQQNYSGVDTTKCHCPDHHSAGCGCSTWQHCTIVPGTSMNGKMGSSVTSIPSFVAKFLTKAYHCSHRAQRYTIQ